MHLMPPPTLIRTILTTFATHHMHIKYIRMQIKFDTHMTRAILYSHRHRVKETLHFGGGLPHPYSLHLRHNCPTLQSCFLQSVSLTLRAHDGLKGGETGRRHCALAPLRPPASSRARASSGNWCSVVARAASQSPSLLSWGHSWWR